MEPVQPLKQTTTRRGFLSAALAGFTQKSGRMVSGGFADRSHELGHRLRDRAPFDPPKEQRRVPLVICGGGIAGLSAAWWLEKRGFHDFIMLEMEARAGGNSRWGEHAVSPFAWAAHYVPVPGPRALLVRELFEELGVLRGGQFEERYLCHSPQERLFIHGRWQEGIEPSSDLTAPDRQQFQRFAARIEEFRASRQFTIPMEDGARPSPLDRLSMQDWLRGERFTSPHLDWYVNYACRDDYGARAASVSAWAGIHYFASRESEDKGPLTWAEGNGWIVKRLLARLGRYVRTGAMVSAIRRDGRRLRVRAGDAEYAAGAVIFAAPSFLAPYIVEGFPPLSGWVYSPWLTACLVLDHRPAERGAPAAWDNVIYGSPSLGYVSATHQSLRTRWADDEPTVWTYYLALDQHSPAAGRRLLLEKDWAYWKEFILADLERAHPEIRQLVSRIDILRLGHAMIRPTPGFVFSETRARLARPSAGNVFFANSDLSGLSLFEEAQYRGVTAATRALRLLSR